MKTIVHCIKNLQVESLRKSYWRYFFTNNLCYLEITKNYEIISLIFLLFSLYKKMITNFERIIVINQIALIISILYPTQNLILTNSFRLINPEVE